MLLSLVRQVLVGAQVTCDEQDDDRDWRLVLQLLQVLGRQHVMGKLSCTKTPEQVLTKKDYV